MPDPKLVDSSGEPEPGRFTAVVTGTSSGIGLAIATKLNVTGWDVIGLSRTRGALPAEAHWLPCDLSEPQSIHHAIREVRVRTENGVNTIVHAAGLQRSGRLGTLDISGGERMWTVHVHAAEMLVDGLVGSMVDDGRIVLIGSRTMSGIPGKSQYAATKAALGALARAWAAELADRQITVNVVAPGPTRTPMLKDPQRASTPPRKPMLGRLIEPSEVADLVGFLLGPAGAMITGQTIVICGGASLDRS